MKPQIIDRYVYVKGKKISEATSKSNLDGNEVLPLAYNDVNYNTTVDQISEYVDKVHDYLTTENYNDLKGQIDSERTNRQEADSELNQSIQDTKSELHSTISGVESELLNEVNDLQEQIDSINETGISNGVTLDTVQTITGEKTFTTVPKSTADATEDTDLVNKKYVDDAVANVDVDLDGYATQAWVNEQGFAKTSDIPEGLEIGETTGTAFDGGRGKAVEDVTDNLPQNILGTSGSIMPLRYDTNETNDVKVSLVYNLINKLIGVKTTYHTSIPSATTTKAGVMSAADKQKLDNIPTLTTSGDGTKYLSDNGTYKTIEAPDLSNYLTEDDKTELETEIGDLSENVNAQVTALQKKDSTIEGNITNLTETVNTINDTVSGLDNKYLPLSGGTLTGNLTINAALQVNDQSTIGGVRITANRNEDQRLAAYSNNTYGHTAIGMKQNEFNLYTYDPKTGGPSGVTEYKIYHENNVVGSKVTTNDVSGGLNITSITQAAYDGLDSKNANTLYIITE